MFSICYQMDHGSREGEREEGREREKWGAGMGFLFAVVEMFWN